jgi:hypothetical protein
MRCAPNTALGCAAGAVVSTNKKSVVPPKEANSSGELALVIHKAKVIATDDPINTQIKRNIKVFIL